MNPEPILILHLFQNNRKIIFNHIITNNLILLYSYHTLDNNYCNNEQFYNRSKKSLLRQRGDPCVRVLLC
jgi:hypothetical protein